MDNTEQHRHRSECRHYLAQERQRGGAWFRRFIADWKRWTGSALQKDFNEQRRLGNTGRHGEWIEIVQPTGENL